MIDATETTEANPILARVIGVLVLLVFSVYFVAESGQANAFAVYLLALAMIGALLRSEYRNSLASAGSGIWAWVISLVCYLGLSSAWSDYPDTGEVLRNLGKGLLILSFMSGLMVSLLRLPAFRVWLLVSVVAAGCFSALMSIYLHWLLPEYQPLPEPRLYAFGRLSNPAIAAMSYGMVVYMAVMLLLQLQVVWQRFLVVVALLALLAAIVLTGSRAVWLAIALSVSLGVALQFRRRAIPLFLGGSALVGVASVMLLGWEAVARRGLSFRPEIWSEFISRTLTENWLLGVGTGTDTDWVTPILTFQHPHSLFLSTFHFGGVIGLLLLGGVIVWCFRLLLQAEPSPVKQLAIVASVYAVTMGLFDGRNILESVNFMWWISWLPVTLVMVAAAETSTSTTTPD